MSEQSQNLNNIGKREIPARQDDGETNHARANPVPGAFGDGQHEETQAPHTPNIDKAHRQD